MHPTTSIDLSNSCNILLYLKRGFFIVSLWVEINLKEKMATLKRSLLLCMLAFLVISSIVNVPAQAAESDFFYLNLVVHLFNFAYDLSF
jgi:hypothetical protein